MFDGYFEDVGTIGSFYQANLDLTDPLPRFNFYEPLAPIYTHPRFLPGSKIDDCTIVRSLVTEGVILNQCRVERSVLGVRARVAKGASLKEALIMGADFYQLPHEVEAEFGRGTPAHGYRPRTRSSNAPSWTRTRGLARACTSSTNKPSPRPMARTTSSATGSSLFPRMSPCLTAPWFDFRCRLFEFVHDGLLVKSHVVR